MKADISRVTSLTKHLPTLTEPCSKESPTRTDPSGRRATHQNPTQDLQPQPNEPTTHNVGQMIQNKCHAMERTNNSRRLLQIILAKLKSLRERKVVTKAFQINIKLSFLATNPDKDQIKKWWQAEKETLQRMEGNVNPQPKQTQTNQVKQGHKWPTSITKQGNPKLNSKNENKR